MLKKIFALLLVLTFVFAFAACVDDDTTSEDVSSAESVESEVDESEDDESEVDESEDDESEVDESEEDDEDEE